MRVYITEVQSGSGDYSVEVTNLLPETEYRYQMNETVRLKLLLQEVIIRQTVTMVVML